MNLNPSDYMVKCAYFKCSNRYPSTFLTLSPDVLNSNLFWFCDTCKEDLISNEVICNNLVTEEIEPEAQLNLNTIIDDVPPVNTTTPKLDALTDVIFDFGTQVSYLTTDCQQLRQQLDLVEAHSKNRNIEITGVPFRSNERIIDIYSKICSLLEINQDPSCIDRIHRIKPSTNNNKKSIIIEFKEQSTRDIFLSKAKLSKNLLLANLGFEDTHLRFFVNEHLTRLKKNILYRLKLHKEEIKFDRLWVKRGQIYVRFSDRVINVASNEILNGLLRSHN